MKFDKNFHNLTKNKKILGNFSKILVKNFVRKHKNFKVSYDF